ncbi:Ankyrin repeat protein [Rickettsiales bacterium Ac37b]|nr:Ankyrin repeat protein [Rickettsiales bacterium Ac37b]
MNVFHQIASNHNSIALGIIAKIEKYLTKSDLNLYSDRNQNGETPFLLALSNSNYAIASELLSSQERMLKKFGYSENKSRKHIKKTINIGNNFNYTPLHELARTGFSQDMAKCLLKTILEKGANPNARDSNGNTPAHAIFNLSDYNKQTEEYEIVRIVVSRRSATQILDLLKKYNVDVAIQNKDGYTAYDLLAKTTDDFKKENNNYVYCIKEEPQTRSSRWQSIISSALETRNFVDRVESSQKQSNFYTR